MQVAVPNTCQNFGLSVLAQGFVDAALGELVLARDSQWREPALGCTPLAGLVERCA